MLTADDPLPHRPRRVLVAGTAGTGKTTLAARIAAVTGGPHTEIDALFHGPGWTARADFLDDVTAFTDAATWTTEWQYARARPLLADRADLLVWLDLPFWRVTFPRVMRRTTLRRIRHERLWNGNVEPPLHTFFTRPEHIVRWSISTRGKCTELVPPLANSHPDLTIVRLRRVGEVDRWLTGPLTASCPSPASEGAGCRPPNCRDRA